MVTITKKLKTQKNTKKIIIELFAILIIFAIVVIFLADIKPKKALIKNLSMKEINNTNYLFFTVENKNDFTVDCSAYVTIGKAGRIVNLGLFLPKQEKPEKILMNFPFGKTDFKINLDCAKLENVDECIPERDISEQYFCVALFKNNAEFCNKISVEHRKQHCLASIKNDQSVCNNIQEQNLKDWCYQDYGMNKQDERACEKIKDESKKLSCLGGATSNPDLCRKTEVNLDDKYLCFSNLAEFMDNISLCDELKNLSKKCYEELSFMK